MDGSRSSIEHVRINHGGGNVRVTEKLLNGSDVVTGFQQMRRKRVPEGVAMNRLWDFGYTCRLPYCSLQA